MRGTLTYNAVALLYWQPNLSIDAKKRLLFSGFNAQLDLRALRNHEWPVR